MYTAASDDTEAPPQPHSETSEGGDEEEEDEAVDVSEEDEGDGTATIPTTSNAVSAGNSSNLVVTAVPNLDGLFGLREIGRESLCWKLSSAKPGNGVEQIRDHSIETYWQSDGTTQPHWIQVHFARRVAISHVCLYLDYNLDESYTPKKIRVEAGMTNQDLQSAVYPDTTQIELQEPVGWCIIPLSSPPDPLDDYDDDPDGNNNNNNNHDPHDCSPWNDRMAVRAHLIRISVLSMHQNGRDTHVRQVQLYGPRMSHAAKLLPVQATTTTTTTAGPMDLRRDAHNHRQAVEQDSSAHYSTTSTTRLCPWEDDFTTVAMSQFSTIR